MSKKRLVFSVLAASVSAFLLFSSFPPMGESVNILFAIVPLLLVSRFSSVKQSAWTYFGAGMIFWLATISWMPAISKNGGPLPLVILGQSILSTICALYFTLFGVLDTILWKKINSFNKSHLTRSSFRILALIVFEPLLWAGCEWLRGWVLSGFAWNFLGTSISQYPQYALPARFGGVYLVSALLVIVNGVFATMIERVISKMARKEEIENEKPKSPYISRLFKSLETALPLIVVFVIINAAKSDYVSSRGETIPVRAALMQPNEPCIFTKDTKHENPYLLYESLLQIAKYAKVDIIILPESGMCRFGDMAKTRAKNFARFLSNTAGGAAVFSGGDSIVETNGVKKYYNAASIYHPQFQDIEIDVYAKRHLVPCGEYIPLDKTIPALQKLSPIGVSLYPGEKECVNFFVKGKTADTNALTKITLGPLICFEDTDPLMALSSAQEGAQLLILITNDSWFSFSNETLQHSWQSIMRSIETGLPMLRVGNNGVTGAISAGGVTNWLRDDNGEIIIDSRASQVVTVDVELNPKKTLYVKLGNYPLGISFALLSAVLLFGKRRKREDEV